MTASRALLAVAVLAALVGSGVLAGPAAADGQDDAEPLSADSIVVNVEVRDDGAAEWSIQYKYRLDTPNRTRGFERLRERITAREEAYVADVRRDVEQTVRIAENQTDREMTVGNVSVEATRQTVPQDYGIIVHEFTWHGFAVDDGSTMRIGDSIRGFWLQTRTQLAIGWPDGYEASQIEPAPDEREAGEVTWENPDFGAQEPKVVVERQSDAAWSGLTVPGILMLTVLGAAVAIRRTSRFSIVLGDPSPEYAAADPARAELAAADGSGDGATSAAGGAVEAPTVEQTDDDAGDADVPLTNEEQVRRALDRNDGRIKQQEIAELCDWSDSKTSRVVRSLEEQGVVEVFRIGRENVVSSTEVAIDDE